MKIVHLFLFATLLLFGACDKTEGQLYAGTQPATLSEREAHNLAYLREEEKLARDVYTTLYEKWQVPVFRNIPKSEQAHTNAVLALLQKFGVPDPVTDPAVGAFTNVHLQQLYAELVAKGLTSLAEAYTVGATIEDLDIYDLNKMAGETENADILAVITNLTNGSKNHMRAFYRQLTGIGITYSAQFITQAELDVILK